MEKILTIDGRQVKFKSTGAFLLRYKAQFRRDALQDIFKLEDAIKEVKNEETGKREIILANKEALDLEVMYDLVWTLAKTADPNILPPMEWLDGFSEFPLMEILPELMDMMFSCLTTSVPSKKK